MERRQVITSLCTLLGLGGTAAAKPSISSAISKTSTPCEVSEYARAAREAQSPPTGGPSSAPTQKSASPQA